MPLPSIVDSTRSAMVVAPEPPPFEEEAAYAAPMAFAADELGGAAAPMLAPAVVLPFAMEPQQQTQWCWSALAVSVARYYEAATPWAQCTLAGAVLAVATCCQRGSAPECNRPFVLHVPLDTVGKLNVAFPTATPFENVLAEIGGERPVACRVGWYHGGGHFVVLYGFDDPEGRQWVFVADPWWGTSIYPYAGFASAYRGAGRWTHTYLTRP